MNPPDPRTKIRRRLEDQAKKLGERLVRLDDQVTRAAGVGRTDLERIAVRRRRMVFERLNALNLMIAGLDADRDELR
jgi:hypothetical protein